MKRRKRNILLISPASDNEALWVTGEEGPEVKNNFPPLGLATIAGLTPDEFHVEIWDELVHGLIDERTRFERDYDLVGITGYKAHLPRCRELAKIFKKRSIPVALGGPGVSATPEDYRGAFDILFIGEAERIWPRFLADWDKDVYDPEYRQIEKIDLAESPIPKWGSISDQFSNYSLGAIQTTRGCPFDCEFCDVIYLFGRRPRHKPKEKVLAEVVALERLGMKNIFFSDDEFIGDPRYTKSLLKDLITLNRSFPRPLSFSTQITMNVSRDEELLELLSAANFNLLFIGIETPNKASLRESHKYHNLKGDLIEDVHRILSYGIAIRAGIIVGFDHDGADIFDIQYDFIQQSFLPSVAINMLKAPAGTKLWTRFREEGRVVAIPPSLRNKLGHPRSYTNIIPKQMTRWELMAGYRALLERVFDWKSFSERMKGFVSLVPRSGKDAGRGLDMVKVKDFIARSDLEPEGTEAMRDILDVTIQRAPHLLNRVFALSLQHKKYRESIKSLLPQVDRQIDLESSGRLVFEPDQTPVVVSSGFIRDYRTVFPEVHNRVYSTLTDRTKTPEALVEVFVDFLAYVGHGFERMEPHHRVMLDEICDRTCAKFNGRVPGDGTPEPTPGVKTPKAKVLGLGDDVLRNVEQNLNRLKGLES